MLILLDSGILLRLVNRSDPQHASVRAALRLLKQRGDFPVTAPQNIAEFWNVCTRPTSARGGYGLSVTETMQKLRLIERLFPVIPDAAPAYSVWKQLAIAHGVMGVQVHDARLVALMVAQGISHILTLNVADFARYPNIVPQSPADIIASVSAPAPP